MAGSTSKRIVAVRFDRESVQGFVDPQSWLKERGAEVLTSSGSVVTIPYDELKAVCFVRSFEPGPVWRENRVFANRPKTEGLWLRMQFRDGDILEGVLSNNLLLLDPHGFDVTPPDPGLNQRIFIPRGALSEARILGVVNRPLRATRQKTSKDQLKMFD